MLGPFSPVDSIDVAALGITLNVGTNIPLAFEAGYLYRKALPRSSLALGYAGVCSRLHMCVISIILRVSRCYMKYHGNALFMNYNDRVDIVVVSILT